MDESHYDETGSKLSAIEYQEKIRHLHKKSLRERTGFAGKTLWDFIQLLLFPLILAWAGAWFSHVQSQTSLQVSDRQEGTSISLAADQRRETTLQTYLDNMSDLDSSALLVMK